MTLTPAPAPINPVDLAYVTALTEEEREFQAGVLKARAYHAGTQQTFLTDRLRQFLQLDSTEQTFRLNFVRQVVMAVIERLQVNGFDCADDGLRAWAEDVWADNRMDARQNDAHLYAVRDGEGFVIVDWDAEAGRPRLSIHPRYTGTDVSYTALGKYGNETTTTGDGYGCQMVYPYGDINQPALYAVRRFSDYDPASKTLRLRSRATLYYPERIEKYAYDGGWKPVKDKDDEPWPIPWTDGSGPLGIAVVHFANAENSPEAYDGWPIQDLIDKTTIDLLGASDLTAFRLFVALGWMPTDDGKPLASDGSNALKLEPGQIIGTTKSASEADFKAVDGADLSNLIDVCNKNVIDLAQVTNTPVARFVFLKQIASAETLKGQETPFAFKVRQRQALFGYGWNQCLQLARQLQNLYGEQVSEDMPVTVAWEPVSEPSQAERYAEWEAKVKASVPREQIWAEMGYTAEQIAGFQTMPSYAAQMALLAAGMGARNG